MNIYRNAYRVIKGRKKPEQASITLMLSLLLLVLLSILGTAFYSARIAAARVAMVCGLEQGLYSTFAQYDRELFGKYGLLFADGGYGAQNLRLSFLLDQTEEYADYIVHPAKGALSAGKDIVGIGSLSGSITGYVLASDQEGAAYVRQVCELMEKKAGPDLIALGWEELQQLSDGKDRQKKEKESYQEPEKDEEIEPAEVPPDFQNPIPGLKKLKQQDLLTLVIPSDRTVSGAEMDDAEWIDRREVQLGMNMVPESWRGGLEKAMLIQYAGDFFPNFVNGEREKGLQYRLEAILSGQNSDRENLRRAVTKIQEIRQISNLLYLMADPEKSAEADQAGLFIATLVTQPELAPVMSFLLKNLWAYAEGIADVRCLLSGGKVPMVKDDRSWHLSLGQLADPAAGLDGAEDKGSGLDYQTYLKILMAAESSEKMAAGMMTMTEYGMRAETEPCFRMDNMVDALSVELTAPLGQRTLSVERSYCYE